MEKQNKIIRHEPQLNGLSTVSNGLHELPRSEKAKIIAKSLVHINRLVAYPLSSQDIISWSNDIDRLEPSLDLSTLQFVMDSFKKGVLDWEKDKGIQNIFNGLKQVVSGANGELKIRNFTW